MPDRTGARAPGIDDGTDAADRPRPLPAYLGPFRRALVRPCGYRPVIQFVIIAAVIGLLIWICVAAGGIPIT